MLPAAILRHSTAYGLILNFKSVRSIREWILQLQLTIQCQPLLAQRSFTALHFSLYSLANHAKHYYTCAQPVSHKFIPFLTSITSNLREKIQKPSSIQYSRLHDKVVVKQQSVIRLLKHSERRGGSKIILFESVVS